MTWEGKAPHDTRPHWLIPTANGKSPSHPDKQNLKRSKCKKKPGRRRRRRKLGYSQFLTPEYDLKAFGVCDLIKRMEEEVEKKSKNKKRFSDEQVKYLEAVFESESKLEPRKKEEVAAELGMQPRQVAIWFQNKRARWKSKQIEQDYKALRDSYDNLTSKFESLKTEKQSLLAQLQQLLEKPAGGGGGGGRGINLVESSSSDGRSNAAGEVAKLSCQDHRLLVKCSDEDNNNNNNKGRSHQEGPAHELLLNRCENGDHVSQETNGKWFGFGSGGIYDQSCNISQLWDFWSN